MPTTTRKRKLSSLDSDSHPSKKDVMEETSPVKRRSPRKKPPGRLDKENCPSPQKSPRRPAVSPAKSPRKTPVKPTIVTSSFYGKHKTVYLTPLERKAVKESLPSPPPPLPSPPVQAKKPEKKRRKNVKGGSYNKPRKVPAGSSKVVKTAVKSYAASTKTTKLSEVNSSVAAKPASATTAAPTGSVKQPEVKRAITITFSSLKPKPKIFVGAAFFSTGKKPTSMYKKSAPRSSARPASVQGKSSGVATSQKKSEGTTQQQQQPAAAVTNTQQKRPEKADVQPVKTEDNQLSTKPRAKFDPTDWMDSVTEEPETPQTLSSPKLLTEKYGITNDLKIVLTRTPTPSCAAIAKTQDDSPPDDVPVPVFELSDISPINAASSPPKEAAVYPIFGSASKRLKKASLQPPVSCSTPSGQITALQTASASKERSCRRRKEKQDDDQLIIDAGQKQFGAITCSSCGMVYSADNPEDHFQHSQFHQRFIESIKFVGWKKERVVAEFWDGKILLVMPDDPKYATKKAEDVRHVADSELGFQQMTLSRPTQAKTYLFINTERMVVGCLVAEPIRQAYRVLEQPDRQKDMTRDDFMERHRAWCCDTVPEQALCGISRIWVFSLARRQHIATRLLDTVRSTFMYGSHLTKQEIAFSDPTPDGKLFATEYCNTPTFLVYNFVA